MYIDIEVLERLVRLAIILAFAVVGIVFCGSILRIMKQYRLNLKERNNLKLQLAIIKSQQDLNQNKKIITPEEAFNHLCLIKVNKKNAFLFDGLKPYECRQQANRLIKKL